MALAYYAGPRPEVSFALPIPKALLDQPLAAPKYGGIHDQAGLGFRLRLEPGWGMGAFSSHNESVVLPAGYWRTISRWPALWLAAARRRPEDGGPWIRLRLSRVEWIACCNELGRWFSAAEVLNVTSRTNALEVFRDSENRPLRIINSAGEWLYTPGAGLKKLE